MNPIDVLKKYWGYTQFRLKQEEIISQIISNNDTLALLPTGGGKSICFQIPSLMKEGICLVISPLISLMDDQVRYLQSKGIKSASISSNMYYHDIETVLNNCLYGGIKFLYLSPEKLQNDLIKNRIKDLNINLIAIDEAHCISEWGHNFRPSYRNISAIRDIIKVPILALTASATKEVCKDIQKNLLFKKENLIYSSYRRDNISYVVDSTSNKIKGILKLLNKIKSSTIIYVRTRKASMELTKLLIKNNFSAEYYHAGLSIKKREATQIKWTNNEIRIIVATSAFGMGINKLDVKLVIHMYLPSSLEQYFQESGRVGRNGKSSYAFLFANNNDIIEQKNILNLKYPSNKEIINVYQNINNYLQIGIGDFPLDPITFNIRHFNEKYNISLLKTYYVLKYLEKESLLKFSVGMYSPSKIKFLISNSELYKFQISNKYYDPFIKLLLRNYTNPFDNAVIINEEKLAIYLNISKQNVTKILYKLKQLEILEYQEKNKLDKIKFLQARKDLSISHINQNKWIERKLNDENKLNKIIEYISQNKTCRSQKLLKYFGEEQLNTCKICDICITKNKKHIA